MAQLVERPGHIGKVGGSNPSEPTTMSKKIIVSNTIYQLIGKLFTTVSTLLVTVFITRKLGAVTFGEFSIVLSYITPLFIICDFGVNAIVAKEFAKDKNAIYTHFKSALFLRIVISWGLIALGLSILPFTPYSLVVKTSILIGMLLVFTQAVFNGCNIIFQTNSSYKFATYAQIISSVLAVLLVSISINYHLGLLYIVYSFVLANLSLAFISYYTVRKYVTPRAKLVNLNYWKKTLTDSSPLGLALILNTFMVASDRLLLSFLATPTDVGIYSLAYKIFDGILVVPTFMMNSAYPFLVKKLTASSADFKLSLNRLVKTLFGLSILISVVIILSGRFVISFIWGIEMVSAYYPLAVLVSGLFTFFLSSPYSWALVVMEKQKRLPVFYGLGLIFNVVANLILIPQYGYMACAYITILTEFIVLILVYREVRISNLLQN